MKFGVVTFPGSNCDEDMIHVLETSWASRWNGFGTRSTTRKNTRYANLLVGLDGDYLRSGADCMVLADHAGGDRACEEGWTRLRCLQWIPSAVRSRLVPGALLHNEGQKFISKNIFIRRATGNSALTNAVPDKALRVLDPHGEGRYHADAATLKALRTTTK